MKHEKQMKELKRSRFFTPTKGPIKAGGDMSGNVEQTHQATSTVLQTYLGLKHTSYALPVNIFVQKCVIHVCVDDGDGSLAHLLL